ncbi:DUF1922 domain-containing protein [Candidatus Bathyarchaeota archaeon]|nr:DUF1922 domain-containing protein [Candidatus Bathyarchaeota archaeon]
MYLIVRCYKCGSLLLACSGVKTKTCPYCGSLLKLDKVIVAEKARSAREASRKLRLLKEKAVKKRCHPTYQSL